MCRFWGASEAHVSFYDGLTQFPHAWHLDMLNLKINSNNFFLLNIGLKGNVRYLFVSTRRIK